MSMTPKHDENIFQQQQITIFPKTMRALIINFH